MTTRNVWHGLSLSMVLILVLGTIGIGGVQASPGPEGAFNPLLQPPWMIVDPSQLQTAPPQPQQPDPPVPPAPALSHIEPVLRETALAGGEEMVQVLVLASPEAELSRYGEIVTDATYEPYGNRHVFMNVSADNLLKLAGDAGVAFVSTMGPKPEPEPPDPEAPGGRIHGQALSPDAVDTARIEQLRDARSGAQPVQAPNVAGQSAPAYWYENDTQGVYATWDMGITGDGDPADPIKYAVIDTGTDFCNASLLGRWAVNDTGSVYDGWPLAYDDRSASDFVFNYPAGGSGFGGNWGWYVNAGRTITGTAPFTFTDEVLGLTYTVTVPSASGVYRYGYHPDWLWQYFGTPDVLLVADSTTSGVYDTVYADGDWSYTFDTTDVTMTQASPAGCLDWIGADGAPDDSWGLLYWISDGTNPLPAVDWIYGGSTPVPDAGEVLMFMINDATGPGGDHGTLCASSAAGYDNGVFYDWAGMLPDWYSPTHSIVAGPGSGGDVGTGADVIALGNLYAGGSTYNYYLYTIMGVDGVPDTADDADVVSLSFGNGSEDADVWDFQSQFLAYWNLQLESEGLNSPVWLASSGNGGYGYGTVNRPTPATGVSVGASTQYGPYDVWGVYEGVDDPSEAVYQDVQPWSDRGPTAMSTLAPHVVANGAWGSGGIPTNLSTYFGGFAGDGAGAWDMWGGTSRSSPDAAGMMTLIYDAYYQGRGMYPDWRMGRQLMMNGTLDLGYDEKVAGAGQAYALRSSLVASGTYGVYVDPPFYQAGSFPPGSGEQYESFAVGLMPGQTDVATFTLYNPTTAPIDVNIWDERLHEVGFYTMTLTTVPSDPVPSNYSYGAPDYLIDLTSMVTQNMDADLMIVRVAYPFEHFDEVPPTPSGYSNRWIELVYNVYDDGDGVFWTDLDMNGRVEISPTVPITQHELDMDDDYIRFAYSYLRSTEQEVRVRHPYDRMGSGGIWLGLTHNTNNMMSTTHNIEVIFYQEMDWEQVMIDPMTLTVPAGTLGDPGMAVFTATVSAAIDEPYGEYMGRIIVEDPGMGMYDGHEIVIPVEKQVWFDVTIDPVLGGTPRGDHPYDNGHVYGAFSWTGRRESGDWRVYPFIVEEAPQGSVILVDNVWEDYPTDIDTLILDQVPSWDFSSDGGGSPPYPSNWFGPYTMDDLGCGSARAGTRPNWEFNTATGTTHEFISCPTGEGLRVLMHHTVLFGGEMTAVPFTTTVGLASVQPNPVTLANNPGVSDTLTMVFKSGLELDGLELGGAAGWFTTTEVVAFVNQGDSWYYPLVVSDSFRLEVETWEIADAPDVDLYVWLDDGNGFPDAPDILMGSSGGSDSNERVVISDPPDGLYFIEVYGYAVTGSPGEVGVRIRNLEGTDAFSVMGLPDTVEANVTYTFTVHVDVAPPETGGWEALLLFGPPLAPMAIEVPVGLSDIAAEKISSNPGEMVEPGDLVTYTVTLTNTGDLSATLTVTDELGDYYTVHDPMDFTEVMTGTLVWTGVVSVGQTIDLHFVVQVNGMEDFPVHAMLENTVMVEDGEGMVFMVTDSMPPQVEVYVLYLPMIFRDAIP